MPVTKALVAGVFPFAPHLGGLGCAHAHEDGGVTLLEQVIDRDVPAHV
jgi:hypothetical protein